MLLADEELEYDSDAQIKMGNRIRVARKKAGFKVIELAEALDISENHMSKIEGGKNMCTTANLFKLGKLLGTSVDYLMYGDEGAQVDLEIMGELQGLRAADRKDILEVIRLWKHRLPA